MSDRLRALVLKAGAAGLGSPAVGWFTALRSAGDVVEPGTLIGRLTVLGRALDVVVPDGISGRLEGPVVERGVAREYGERLFSVVALELGGEAGAAAVGAAADGVVVRAQMDGQFYRRPSPSEPNFVNVGDAIQPGATIGLIEVMKFFYPVLFESDRPAVVKALLAEDSTPVEAGDPLIAVE